MRTSCLPEGDRTALFFDGGLVLVDSTGRRLEVHNEGAAQFWSALAEGLPLDLVLDRIEADAGPAARYAAAALAKSWSTPAPPFTTDERTHPESPAPGAPVRWYAAAPGTVIAFEAEDEALAERLRRLLPFDHAASGKPDIHLRVTRAGDALILAQDGVELLRTPDGNLVQGAIYQTCLNAAHGHPQWRALIHGAAVALGDRAIGFPARSGSGKSTLAAWLVAKGLAYLSDDLLAVLADGRVAPWPTPVSVKPGSMGLLSDAWPQLANGATRESKGVTTRLLQFGPEHCAQAPVPLVAFVFPTYDPAGDGTLRPLRPLEALARLASDRLWLGYPLELDAIAAFLDWLAALPAYELRFATLDSAHSVLRPLLEPSPQ